MENELYRVPRGALRGDILRIFNALGVSRDDASMVADTLIRTEQWGVLSHGILRVKRYVECLQSGGILADAPFTVEKRSGAWALTSANGGLGIPACTKAADLAVELAKEHTVGAVNVRMSHHNGAEGFYTDRVARRGMIGMVMSTGNPIMAVTGASEATLGNNPFSYAVPAGAFGVLMLDAAMSTVADGKIQLARATGKKLPVGCILDREGNPSVEPEDYFNGGVLLPFGAHKGYGLAVMVECLAGILSGAALTHEINSWNTEPGKCGNTGHFILAIDIEKIMPVSRYVSRVEEMVRQFKAARRMPGAEIYYPGELEQRRLREAGETVSLLPSTWRSFLEAGRLAGVSLQTEDAAI